MRSALTSSVYIKTGEKGICRSPESEMAVSRGEKMAFSLQRKEDRGWGVHMLGYLRHPMEVCKEWKESDMAKLNKLFAGFHVCSYFL